MSIKLNNWHVVPGTTDIYKPPELAGIALTGDVFGHPRYPDGHCVTTSKIVKVEGRYVETYSGSKYVLGKINLGYRRYIKKERPNWDWRNPITVFGGGDDKLM